jgi:hypothetical protein
MMTTGKMQQQRQQPPPRKPSQQPPPPQQQQQPQPQQQQQQPRRRLGVMVLGMHRSGTSMLTGLLVTVAGYTVGGPLLAETIDNPKGYFERVDILTQNDVWMKHQKMTWDDTPQKLQRYNPRRAVIFANTTANQKYKATLLKQQRKQEQQERQKQQKQKQKQNNNNNNKGSSSTTTTTTTNNDDNDNDTPNNYNNNNDTRTVLERYIGGLEFLNNPHNAPWIQKDPRNCITLPTWLTLLKSSTTTTTTTTTTSNNNNEPAILFTYRHPLEVSMSLVKREEAMNKYWTKTNNNWTMTRGLELWIIYNQKAIQNSQGLCRIISSNEALLRNPAKEVQRIIHQLTHICGVPPPPHQYPMIDIVNMANQFVNMELQRHRRRRRRQRHETTTTITTTKHAQEEQAQDNEEEEDEDATTTTTTTTHGIWANNTNNGTCVVPKFHSTSWRAVERTLEEQQQQNQQQHDEQVYRNAMKVYCDLESGMAYQDTYVWPRTL